MSFMLHGDGRLHVSLDLTASVNITVPATSWGVVPHDAKILAMDPHYVVFLIKTHRVALDLLIDTSCAPNPGEELVTRVFNLSTKPVRIKVGSVISRLISVRLE